ncbi:hypothetical protein CHUAL_010810 [Chamberlinius hualienensis]
MSKLEAIAKTNYTFILEVEKNFIYAEKYQWMLNNWTQCFVYIGLYLPLIFLGRDYMKSRPRFELKGPLIIWNFALTVFSIFGLIRLLPEFISALQNYGFYYSICNSDYLTDNKVPSYWSWLFVLSKVPELGDTAFVILRKQPLIFLHWYHHATVLIYTWYSYADNCSTGRWFSVMNYTAHSFMYSYYVLKLLKFRYPRQMPMFITTLQLTQMVLGCYVNIRSYQYKASGEHCDVSDNNLILSFLMYFSYFILFSNFFYNAYFKNKTEAKMSAKKMD